MKIILTVIIPVFNQEELILKALKSIPCRKDIEVIVVDDCSTDNTLETVETYQMITEKNIAILHNEKNMGVGYSVNKGLDYANGEYIVLLGSDDYFLDLTRILNELDGTDIVYFDLEINNGNIFRLTNETKELYCGSTKCIRKEFINDIRNPEIRACEDYYFYKKLLEKNPTEKFTNLLVKHYNFPREGSLSFLERKKRDAKIKNELQRN